MLPKTIDGALLNLRAQLVRDGGEGLEHVEALLALRGCTLPLVTPKAPPRLFKRGELRRLVLAELRGGPVRLRTIVAGILVKRPDLAPEATYRAACVTLCKLEATGIVRHRGRAWWVGC